MTTYAVNLETSATSRYSNYDFNSMCVGHDGKLYGMSSDGLVLLDGDTDDGAQIDAAIVVASVDFGTSELKRAANAYAGVSSSEAMVLRVEADGSTYEYAARSFSEELKQQRVDLGKGIRANWLRLTLLNANGGKFELADFSVPAVATTRRI